MSISDIITLSQIRPKSDYCEILQLIRTVAQYLDMVVVTLSRLHYIMRRPFEVIH